MQCMNAPMWRRREIKLNDLFTLLAVVALIPLALVIFAVFRIIGSFIELVRTQGADRQKRKTKQDDRE